MQHIPIFYWVHWVDLCYDNINYILFILTSWLLFCRILINFIIDDEMKTDIQKQPSCVVIVLNLTKLFWTKFCSISFKIISIVQIQMYIHIWMFLTFGAFLLPCSVFSEKKHTHITLKPKALITKNWQ
jgi:hypothetical protein